MKTNFTQRKFYIIYFILVIAIFISKSIFAQPDYTFTNGVLTSGTDKQVGAVYKYTNVRPGVDATVTIQAISAGITISGLDDGSGYDEALQPTLVVAANTTGYLEMRFRLLQGGTNSSYTAPFVPVTCIDVDGAINNDGAGKPLYEFDEINLGSGSTVVYNTTGSELSVTQTGAWVRGKNTGGIDYPGRDTSAKNVMFTVTNTNLSQFTIRVGVDNQSATASTRLRSVYFKKFTYPSGGGTLPVTMSYFNAFAENNSKVVLNWVTETELNNSNYSIERSQDNKNFSAIAMVSGSYNSSVRKTYEYKDDLKGVDVNKTIYYRIKQTDINGKSAYSPVRSVKLIKKQNMIQVNPNPFVDNITVKYMSEVSGTMRIRIVNANGQVVVNKTSTLVKGYNYSAINNLGSLAKGLYIVEVTVNGEFSEKTKLMKN